MDKGSNSEIIRIQNNTIANNICQKGAGILIKNIKSNDQNKILSNLISNNEATDSSGGGIEIEASENIKLENNTI